MRTTSRAGWIAFQTRRAVLQSSSAQHLHEAWRCLVWRGVSGPAVGAQPAVASHVTAAWARSTSDAQRPVAEAGVVAAEDCAVLPPTTAAIRLPTSSARSLAV